MSEVPGALTRVGFQDRVLHLNRTSDNLPTMRAELLAHDATRRATITQQAQELENLKGNYAIQKAAADDYEQQLAAMTRERDAFQVGQLEVAKFLGYGIGEHLSLQSFIMQQLAAMTAELEEYRSIAEKAVSQLAASQERVKELESTDHH